MPQASGEVSEYIEQEFGCPMSDEGPMKFLEDAGYVLRGDWFWKAKPGVTTYGDMTKKEYLCMIFLCQEWDFGGLGE